MLKIQHDLRPTLINEVNDRFEVGLCQVARRQRWRTESETAWLQCTPIARTRVLIDGYVHQLKHFLGTRTVHTHGS